MSTKKYWFFIEPYVHISIKSNCVLLYNSISGQTLEYSTEPGQGNSIFNLIKKLKDPKNQGVVSLTDKDLEDKNIMQLVMETGQYFIGDIVDAELSQRKPALMPKTPTIGKDVRKLGKKENRSVGEELMGHIVELSLYINNACSHNCASCNTGYRQFLCCTKRGQATKQKNDSLELSKIESLMEELKSGNPMNINILGGDIFQYPQFRDLSLVLNRAPFRKVYYIHYLNIEPNAKKLILLNPCKSSLKIPVTFPLDQEKFKTALELLKKGYLRYELIFIIRNGEDYQLGEQVASSMEIKDYRYQPWFDGENLSFFEQNVFNTKEEILKSRPPLNDIYVNQMLNKLSFGRLVVLPDASIYANVNEPRLGVLGKETLHQTIYKELCKGKSWFRVRKNVEPCKRCTLEAICPPLIDYSYAIGKNNLCHVELGR